ncbi:MAG TPA: M56 family metallopeptidase, partial [Puia sp.]|nr:M56 family metallopeptidase [Puia sp.]
GVIILGINMVRQMILLLIQRCRGPVVRDGKYRIITASCIHSPCSFGNIIFIQPQQYDTDTYQQILLHEKVHAGGWHTVDILLAELSILFQWFNPFIWLLRREMENNLEFLTDRRVLQHPGIERSAYQLSLVKVAAPDLPLSITSNYNQSLLKRRIIMMNAQNSSRHTAWKYIFMLPLFIFLTGILNRPAALAQRSKDQRKERIPPVPAVVPAPPAPVVTNVSSVDVQPVVAVPPVRTDVQVMTDVQMPVPVVVPDVAVVPGSPVVQVRPVIETAPVIAPVPPIPSVDTSKPSSRADRMEGSWFITNYKQDNKDKITIDLRDQDDDHQWNSSFSVPRNKLNLTSVGKVEFDLTREAGNMHFTGQFDGEQGFGHYKFQADAGYLARMREKKIVVDEDELLSFFLLDINKGYMDMLQANGYPDVSKGHLISMSALGIDEPYIKGVREMGYPDLSEGRLITFKALHIDRDYIGDLRKAGYDHLPAEKLITFKSLKIDGDYLRKFPASTSPQDIITYKSLRIDSDYVASLKREGYSDIPSRDLVSLRSLNVTPEYIRGLHDMGYSDVPVHDLISLKSLGVTPEYVKSFQGVGMKDIPAHDLNTLKSMGITPDYVRGFMALGYKDISVRHLASLKSMGITPEFIKGFNDIGFKNIPLNQLTSLKAVGVTPSYVSKMKEKGLISDDLNKYIRLKSSWE